MKVLRPELDLEAFFARLAAAAHGTLMLDYDGTLAPFKVSPKEAIPYPEVPGLLDQIMAGGHTRLVIVSGRPARDLQPLLGLRQDPEVWGSHGWERLRPDGRYELAPLAEGVRRRLQEAGDTVADAAAMGALLEVKPTSVAVHWRGLEPDIVRRVRDAAERRWRALAGGLLEVHGFDGGLELRPRGRSKGDAVRTVLDEMPAATIAAYLGDDATDEDAFRAIRSRGLGVLVRDELRATAADVWLTPPRDLLEFLQRWASVPVHDGRR